MRLSFEELPTDCRYYFHIRTFFSKASLRKEGPNVKVISAISWELFKRQSHKYRQTLITDSEWNDSMIITNGAKRLMHKWIANSIVEEYSMSPETLNILQL